MKKICIVLTSLSDGGAQRAGAVLAQLLDYQGYNVTIIITQSEISYDYSGLVYSIYDQTSHSLRVIKPFKFFFTYKRLVDSGDFDCIIDGRHRPTWFKQRMINNFIYRNLPVIYIVHSHNLRVYLPLKKWMVRDLYAKKAGVVGVSKLITQRIVENYGLENVQNIANTTFPGSLKEQASQKVEMVIGPYILYYGRLYNKEKNLVFLIEAYANSVLPGKNINLLILGSGIDETMLKDLAREVRLEDKIIFKEFTKNPFPYVQQALFTTLTSHFEGFPMVLIESLMLGVPVVSVDCPSGPSEVIRTGCNGVLVPQYKPKAFIEALNKMVMDEAFYKECKSNAANSVVKFSPETIGLQWQALLDNVIKKDKSKKYSI